jgi:hypothetical protein
LIVVTIKNFLWTNNDDAVVVVVVVIVCFNDTPSQEDVSELFMGLLSDC